MTDTAVIAAPLDEADLIEIASSWLTAFENGARAADFDALAKLFVEDCWWRDLLTITWDLTTARGMAQIREKYGDRLLDVGFRSVSLAAKLIWV